MFWRMRAHRYLRDEAHRVLALGPQTAGTNLQEMMAIILGPARIRCLFTRYLRRGRSRIADPLHQQSDEPFASDARLGLTKTYARRKARVAPEKKHRHVLKRGIAMHLLLHPPEVIHPLGCQL